MRALMVVGLVILSGCAPRYRKKLKIATADTPEGIACFRAAQESHDACRLAHIGTPKCNELRDRDLWLCPGARDVTGEPDSTTYGLPGVYR